MLLYKPDFLIMVHIVATGPANRPGPERLPPWSDQFLLIQPSSLGFRNPNRTNEIKVVHENNGRVFSNILHPDIRKFSELFDLALIELTVKMSGYFVGG